MDCVDGRHEIVTLSPGQTTRRDYGGTCFSLHLTGLDFDDEPVFDVRDDQEDEYRDEWMNERKVARTDEHRNEHMID